MRSHPDDFISFLELTPHPDDVDGLHGAFNRYCDQVAQSADWGGHPELLALVNTLKLPIRVHSADAPPLVVGWEEYGVASPLEISYHRHFYALGEHYNSTEPS